ncbi:MAG: hypothetical protein ABIR30_04120 [Chitinophagaceae bacterium]
MQTKPAEMTTLTAVLEKLTERKQDNEFKMTPEGFTSNNNKCYNPEDLTIIKTYRFEGPSDPADSSILYLVEANDGLVGYSLDAYGAYSEHDEKYNEFIRKIKIEERDEQILFGEENQ